MARGECRVFRHSSPVESRPKLRHSRPFHESLRRRCGAVSLSEGGGPSTMAAQAAAVADGSDVATVAVRALAGVARPLAPACARVADPGGMGRVGMARHDALPPCGRAPARGAAGAVVLEFLRAELPHLRSPWRPA